MNEILFLLTSIRSSRYCRYALYSSSSTSFISKATAAAAATAAAVAAVIFLAEGRGFQKLLLGRWFRWKPIGQGVRGFPRSQSISALETTSPIKSKKNQPGIVGQVPVRYKQSMHVCQTYAWTDPSSAHSAPVHRLLISSSALGTGSALSSYTRHVITPIHVRFGSYVRARILEVVVRVGWFEVLGVQKDCSLAQPRVHDR